ncbi:hypothetical protein [Streptomyces sp. NPDC058486]|uniref:hypothetical protein n=1 Tax=unclassified Streptomyces TaxID=2593676 RepID=UPI00365EB439
MTDDDKVNELYTLLGRVAVHAAYLEFAFGAVLVRFKGEDPLRSTLAADDATKVMRNLRAEVVESGRVSTEQLRLLDRILNRARTAFDSRNDFVHGQWIHFDEGLWVERIRRDGSWMSQAPDAAKLRSLGDEFERLEREMVDWLGFVE